MSLTFEQRNPYKGDPPRAWVRLRLIDPQGMAHEMDLLADTGCPFDIIIGLESMSRVMRRNAGTVDSNFGPLEGGWLQIIMPELGLDREVLGFASNAVQGIARADCPDLAGLAGLPLLRLLEYGGNAEVFWVRIAGKP